METVNERMKILIDELTGGRQSFFAEKLGVGQSTINSIVGKRQNKPGYDLLNRIKTTYPEVNIDWLVAGDGEMFWGDKNIAETKYESLMKEKDLQILEKDRFITELLRLVPVERLGKDKVIDQ